MSNIMNNEEKDNSNLRNTHDLTYSNIEYRIVKANPKIKGLRFQFIMK